MAGLPILIWALVIILAMLFDDANRKQRKAEEVRNPPAVTKSEEAPANASPSEIEPQPKQ